MKLKENIELFYDDNLQKVIITGGTTTFSIIDPDKVFFNKFLNIDGMSPESEIGKFLVEKNLVYPNYVQYAKYNTLNNRTLQYILDKSYSQISISDLILNKILNQPILIIGCGGVGTIVLNNLVQAGFKKFSIIDNDIVEESNLNRQLFYSTEDFGKKKTQILKNKILKLDPNVSIQSYETFISNKEQISEILDQKDYQIVVNCADTPNNIETIVSETCCEKGTPVISGFVGLETGTINPIYDEKNPFKKNVLAENSQPLKASISTTNMITSALLSQIIFDYLFKDIVVSSYNFYATHIINFKTMEIKADD